MQPIKCKTPNERQFRQMEFEMIYQLHKRVEKALELNDSKEEIIRLLNKNIELQEKLMEMSKIIEQLAP